MPARRASRASASLGPSRPPPALPQTGKFVPEKSNIWRDCVDGFYDWVKEHIEEVGSQKGLLGSAHLCNRKAPRVAPLLVKRRVHPSTSPTTAVTRRCCWRPATVGAGAMGCAERLEPLAAGIST